MTLSENKAKLLKAGGNPGTHNLTKTREFETWARIKGRCYNKSNKDYPRYGGRGITVCERWLESFENFLADMGQRPSSKHSIDRFPDNDGPYAPGNCRWATAAEQLANRRITTWVEFEGKRVTLAECCARFPHISASVVHGRLRCGWGVKEALSTPVRAISPILALTHCGVTKRAAEWARELGIPYPTLKARIDRGWRVEDALSTRVGERTRWNTPAQSLRASEVSA